MAGVINIALNINIRNCYLLSFLIQYKKLSAACKSSIKSSQDLIKCLQPCCSNWYWFANVYTLYLNWLNRQELLYILPLRIHPQQNGICERIKKHAAHCILLNWIPECNWEVYYQPPHMCLEKRLNVQQYLDFKIVSN